MYVHVLHTVCVWTSISRIMFFISLCIQNHHKKVITVNIEWGKGGGEGEVTPHFLSD